MMSTRQQDFVRTWAPLVIAALGAAATYGAMTQADNHRDEKIQHLQVRVDRAEQKAEEAARQIAAIDRQLANISGKMDGMKDQLTGLATELSLMRRTIERH